MYSKTNNTYPHANDVLCGRGGRGGRSFEHIGTKCFRRLVSENKRHYAMSNSTDEKREIAIHIINVIKNSSPQGRFLTFDKKLMQWEEINNKKAMMKTLQALREDQQYYKETIQQHCKDTIKIQPLSDNESLAVLDYDEINFLIETFCNNG